MIWATGIIPREGPRRQELLLQEEGQVELATFWRPKLLNCPPKEELSQGDKAGRNPPPDRVVEMFQSPKET